MRRHRSPGRRARLLARVAWLDRHHGWLVPALAAWAAHGLVQDFRHAAGGDETPAYVVGVAIVGFAACWAAAEVAVTAATALWETQAARMGGGGMLPSAWVLRGPRRGAARAAASPATAAR